MERQPDLQQPVPVAETPYSQSFPFKSVSRLVLLWLGMLLPWFWVWMGLHFFRDYRITICLYELLGCCLPALLLRRWKFPILPLRLKLWKVILLVACVNLVILGAFQLSNGFGMNWETFYQRMQASHLADDTQFWGFAAYIVILNPIFEEIYWRGIIYREWKNYTRTRYANLISSFFFGAWHYVVLQHYCEPLWALALTLAVMIGGILFADAYEKTGTLAASMLMHGLGADLPMVFVVYDCILQGSHWATVHTR